MGRTTIGLNIRASQASHFLLDHLASKYPLKKHALAKRALELGISVLVEDSRWLANGGDGYTDSYVPREEACVDRHTYLIHHNGGRPWQVKVASIGVSVHGFEKFQGTRTQYNILVHGVTRHQGHWWGFDTSGAFLHGNTVLVKLSDTRYLYVGGKIYEFETEGPVLDYVSPVGNSNVPYPVAFTEKCVYFLVEEAVVDRGDLVLRPTMANAIDLYHEFYGHEGYEAPKRRPLTGIKRLNP